MDSRCFQRNRPTKKNEKDSKKNMSTDSASADIFSKKQLYSTKKAFSTNSKKDKKYHGGPQGRQRRRQGQDSPATSANITLKKEKIDLS